MYNLYLLRNFPLIIALFFTISLSDYSAQINVLDQDDVVLVDSIGSNRICFHRNTECVDSLQTLIISRIKQGVNKINEFIAVKNVEFRVIVFPERTIPSKGMSGAAPNTEHIYFLLDPDHPRLYKSIDEELVATLAHEYHHIMRHRTVGYGSNLFDAIVSEGLAEHFTIEVTNESPPWISPISEEKYLYWRSEAEKIWLSNEYDHLAWFVGLNSEIPRGTGYEIGRRLIAEYLLTNKDKKASEMYSTESKVFLHK